MIRLFFKFFLLIVLTLLFAKWTFEVLLTRRIYEDRKRVVTGVHLGGMRLVAQQLLTAPEERRKAMLEKIQLQFRAPLELRPLSELDNEKMKELKETYGYFYSLQDNYTEYLAIGYDAQEYLRLGPFNDYSTIAFEDSLWGWLQLLAYKINNSDKSSEELHQLSREFGLPLQLCIKEELPESAVDRFQSGRDVAFYPDRGGYYAATKLASDEDYLRVGPLPEFKDVTKPTSQATLTGSFLLSALLMGLLVYSLSRKFRGIENVARSIARGNLAARVDESKSGEVRELARSLNLMAEKTELMIKSKQELLQMVSHELRTPLARLRFAVDLIDTKSEDAKQGRRIEIINQSINDLDLIVSEIIEYVKNKEELSLRSQEWIDVPKALEPISKSIHEENPNLSIEYASIPIGQMPLVYADRVSFLRVAKNIAGNAQRYATSKMIIRVYQTKSHPANNTAVGHGVTESTTCVEFEDDGPGIPEEQWTEVIEPFVRGTENTSSGIIDANTAPPRNPSGPKNYPGIGLGLTIVNRILLQHGGSIQIGRGQLGGCIVRTYWPNPSSQPPIV